MFCEMFDVLFFRRGKNKSKLQYICGENLSSFLRIKRKILGGIVAITHSVAGGAIERSRYSPHLWRFERDCKQRMNYRYCRCQDGLASPTSSGAQKDDGEPSSSCRRPREWPLAQIGRLRGVGPARQRSRWTASSRRLEARSIALNAQWAGGLPSVQPSPVRGPAEALRKAEGRPTFDWRQRPLFSLWSS